MSSEIQIGSTVRSFDFPFSDRRAECYVEGVVEEITDPKTHEHFRDCPRYEIRATRRVFRGQDVEPEAELFYPPVNGTLTTFGDFTDCVELVEQSS
jgi:hypothetical protein